MGRSTPTTVFDGTICLHNVHSLDVLTLDSLIPLGRRDQTGASSGPGRGGEDPAGPVFP